MLAGEQLDADIVARAHFAAGDDGETPYRELIVKFRMDEVDLLQVRLIRVAGDARTMLHGVAKCASPSTPRPARRRIIPAASLDIV